MKKRKTAIVIGAGICHTAYSFESSLGLLDRRSASDITSVGYVIAGTLTERRRELKGGGTAVYNFNIIGTYGRSLIRHDSDGGRLDYVIRALEQDLFQ